MAWMSTSVPVRPYKSIALAVPRPMRTRSCIRSTVARFYTLLYMSGWIRAEAAPEAKNVSIRVAIGLDRDGSLRVLEAAEGAKVR